jgi:hypothetical protein
VADKALEQAQEIKWPPSTDLVFNQSGVVNLKLQNRKMRVFIGYAIELMLQYIGLRDAYLDLTRKSDFIKTSLRQTAKEQAFVEVMPRLKLDKQYTSKIAHVVESWPRYIPIY